MNQREFEADLRRQGYQVFYGGLQPGMVKHVGPQGVAYNRRAPQRSRLNAGFARSVQLRPRVMRGRLSTGGRALSWVVPEWTWVR